MRSRSGAIWAFAMSWKASVRRGGDQILVNVQLVDAESGAHVWADRFETDRQNLAEAQSEITGRLARTLNVELSRDPGRRIELERRPIPTRAISSCGHGLCVTRPFPPASVQEALRDSSARLRSTRNPSMRGSASQLLLGMGGRMGQLRQRRSSRAEQLLLEALERDTNRSMAHVAMGVLRRNQLRLSEPRWSSRPRLRSTAIMPAQYSSLGNIMVWLGQPEAGIPLLEKAIRLNPHDPTSGEPLSRYWGCAISSWVMWTRR